MIISIFGSLLTYSLLKDIGIVVGAILFVFGEKIFTSLKEKRFKTFNYFGHNIKIDVEINSTLKTLADSIGFDRVSILKCHNGQKSFDGISFDYITMTHEETNEKTSRIIDRFQKVPISTYSKAFHELALTDLGYVIISDSNYGDTSLSQSSWGVSQTYNFRLSNSPMDGLLSAAFTHGKVDLNKEEIQEIRVAVFKIMTLLQKKKT